MDYVEKITNELKRLGISVYNVPKKISDPKPPPQLMDALFDANGMKEELEGKLMSASEVISTTLYPHQMMALHWMTYRENGLSLPPFWIGEKGDTYKNLVTNTLVNERPPCALGGILADDMGLGKTLTVSLHKVEIRRQRFTFGVHLFSDDISDLHQLLRWQAFAKGNSRLC